MTVLNFIQNETTSDDKLVLILSTGEQFHGSVLGTNGFVVSFKTTLGLIWQLDGRFIVGCRRAIE